MTHQSRANGSSRRIIRHEYSAPAADRRSPDEALPRLNVTDLGSKKIDAIQALRGIAAVAVVVAHVWGVTIAGDYAVNVFFVISGFTMLYASERQFGTVSSIYPFLIRRFIRIYPIYWLSLILLISIIGIQGASGARHLILSILLLPEERLPILPPAWTLIIEVYFYLIFSIFLFTSRRLSVVLVCFTLFLLACLHGVAYNSFFYYYTNPMILLFGAGVALANVYCNGVRVNKLVSLILITVSFLWVLALSLHDHNDNWRWRVLLLGPPAIMLFIGAVMTAPITLLSWKLLQELGDASYSIYITHWIFIVLLPSPFHFAPLFMALIFGMGLHYAVERPFLRKAYQWVKSTPQSQSTAHPNPIVIHAEAVL
jgi:exopolysaccharide production protein ExoZ